MTVLKMTKVNVNQESISRRHRRKVISSLQLILLKSMTKDLGSIEYNLMMMISRINRILTIRIHHQTMMRKKKSHHQRTVLNTLNLQNHRTKKKMKRKKKEKAVNRRNVNRKPMKVLTR